MIVATFQSDGTGWYLSDVEDFRGKLLGQTIMKETSFRSFDSEQEAHTFVARLNRDALGELWTIKL